jgi:uncharacterized protein
MLKMLVLSVALVAAGVVQAQATAPTPAPASPAKKELVAKLLKLQQPGIENMARQLVEQPARQMLQQAGPALQRLPAERREAVARDIEADVRKYFEESAPIVASRAVNLAPSTIGVLLEERMSEDELREVISILESPANRKFQGMAGDMQRAIGEKLVAETRGEIEGKVRALDQTVARRLGITPPAAAASGARPAAPAKKP